MTTSKAKVVTIDFLGTQFEVLQMPSGEFRIGVSQIANIEGLNFTTPNNATRAVKRLLGAGYELLRVGSEKHPNPMNTLSLREFECFIVALSML